MCCVLAVPKATCRHQARLTCTAKRYQKRKVFAQASVNLTSTAGWARERNNETHYESYISFAVVDITVAVT